MIHPKAFPKKKKLLLAAALAAAGVMLAVVVFAAVRAGKEIPSGKTVASIGGLPVSYGEFTLLMNEHRGDVVTYFYDSYHVDESIDFWDASASFGGECPLDMLKKETLGALKTLKAEQQLMIDCGIVSEKDITYANFRRLWKAENTRRRETLAAGGAVYGPEEYTEIGYYHYLHNLRKQELREFLYKQSGSDSTEDRFTDALIDQKTAEWIENVEIAIEEPVYSQIQAIAQG